LPICYWLDGHNRRSL